MAEELEYPQRWLREHGAVATERGWERPTTQEILKCQKGLLEEGQEPEEEVPPVQEPEPEPETTPEEVPPEGTDTGEV